MEMSKMSNWQWKGQLLHNLERLVQGNEPPRVAVMGVGNELKGDDALGVQIARRLGPRAQASERLCVMEAGLAPENFCGALRRFKPDLVLLIDAAQMDEPPGMTKVVDLDTAAQVGISTHSPSFHMLVDYLEVELGCEFIVLGIQADDLSYGATLSPPVKEAVDTVADKLVDMLVPILRERSDSHGQDIESRENILNEMEFE